MPVSSRALVELVLLGPTSDRRQLQDSPVLGDVWIAYAMKPYEAIDLLITLHKTRSAGPVAVMISRRIDELKTKRASGKESQIAYLQGLVAASGGPCSTPVSTARILSSTTRTAIVASSRLST